MKQFEQDEDIIMLGSKLQKYRKLAKVTQSQIADASGMTKNYISAVERGLHKCSAQTLIVYSKVCGVPLDKICDIKTYRILPELEMYLSTLSFEQQQKALNVVKAMFS